MLKMVKEIAGLCYHLDKLYTGETDRKVKKEIGISFDKMSGILDKAIRSQLDHHDIAYKRSVRKIRKYIKKIEAESEQLEKLEEFLSGISDLGEQLETLLNG